MSGPNQQTCRASERPQVVRAACWRMTRTHQFLFAASVFLLSWLGMMAVHEWGHVCGAVMTGGVVERVILHPLVISRTDVSPNPHPAIVVWTGPVLGCVLPLIAWLSIPQRFKVLRGTLQFFAGFCLIANGSYIGIGSFAGIGDCGEMLRTGTPMWAMIAFGITTVPVGLLLWHRLGTVDRLFNEPSPITPRMAYAALTLLLVVVAVELAWSPR